MLTKMYIPTRNIVLKEEINFKIFRENIKIKKNNKTKNYYKKNNILINFINSWL